MTIERNETMNEDRFQKLSEYLDGDLTARQVEDLERELARDVELRRLLEELRAVKGAAGSIVDRPPRTDLWPGIADRIEADKVRDLAHARRARRTFTLTVPQLAAAMVAALLIGSGAIWVARAPDVAGPGAADPDIVASGSGESADIERPIRTVTDDLPRNPSRKSDLAIAELESKLAEGRGSLDSSTVRVIEESLATIDRAIESAAEALEADPGNVWLNRHLADSKARKLRVLERAAALAVVRT